MAVRDLLFLGLAFSSHSPTHHSSLPLSEFGSSAFPADFMFQLNPREKAEVVTNCDHLRKLKYSARLPFAFTEHGAVMIASVLNSSFAVQASIAVVRAFIRLRQFLATRKELAGKLAELESRIAEHDEEITALFEAIRRLMEPPDKPGRPIGFHGHDH